MHYDCLARSTLTLIIALLTLNIIQRGQNLTILTLLPFERYDTIEYNTIESF